MVIKISKSNVIRNIYHLSDSIITYLSQKSTIPWKKKLVPYCVGAVDRATFYEKILNLVKVPCLGSITKSSLGGSINSSKFQKRNNISFALTCSDGKDSNRDTTSWRPNDLA